jgi:hypothetical protein
MPNGDLLVKTSDSISTIVLFVPVPSVLLSIKNPPFPGFRSEHFSLYRAGAAKSGNTRTLHE